MKKEYLFAILLAGLMPNSLLAQAQTQTKSDKQQLKVEITDSRIDVVSGIIYSQKTKIEVWKNEKVYCSYFGCRRFRDARTHRLQERR